MEYHYSTHKLVAYINLEGIVLASIYIFDKFLKQLYDTSIDCFGNMVPHMCTMTTK